MAIAFSIERYDVLDSTNTAVKRAIEVGRAEGLAVQAARQTAGYGRLGHAWESPDGGLYLSLLLRPQVSDEMLATLPLVAGAAVLEACENVSSPAQTAAFYLKWPNDVLMVRGGDAPSHAQAEKIAGISCEKHLGSVCLGIGVDAADLPCNRTPSPDAVRDAVLAAFAPRYGAWQAEGFAPFAAKISARNILAGREVEVEDAWGRTTFRGTAQSIDEAGRLVLRTAAGKLVRVSSGEAHIVW